MTRRDVLLPALAATPRDLARMLRRVDAAAAHKRPAPNDWSIADVVAHLGDVEQRMLARFQRVVEHENPLEPAIAPDPQAYAGAQPLAALLETFCARRAATIAYLEGLSQRDWGRPLMHAALGPSRLRFQVQLLVEHDNEHLHQILSFEF